VRTDLVAVEVLLDAGIVDDIVQLQFKLAGQCFLKSPAGQEIEKLGDDRGPGLHQPQRHAEPRARAAHLVHDGLVGVPAHVGPPIGDTPRKVDDLVAMREQRLEKIRVAGLTRRRNLGRRQDLPEMVRSENVTDLDMAERHRKELRTVNPVEQVVERHGIFLTPLAGARQALHDRMARGYAAWGSSLAIGASTTVVLPNVTLPSEPMVRLAGQQPPRPTFLPRP
jgi:hypothetical protein